VAFRRGSVSPHSGGTVPDSHRIPLPLAYRARAYHGLVPRKFTLWAPVVLWAGVIFALSSVPSLSTGLGVWDEILRKGAHLTEYAILGILLFRALGSELPALLVGVAYAVTDELHQAFVRGRHASPFDVAFDAAGVALGLIIALSLQSQRARA
jgi:VanZ family protein